MKIIKLESENIKRLYAVSITPAGDIVEISGANGNGKTSVLDSIWWALAGARNIQAVPIRKGAEKAVITLDLGELIVTRRFKKKGENEYTTDVKIEMADGSVPSVPPQEMLNALLSSLTFDPLEFSRMEAKKQYDALRAFVPGVDFQKIEDLNRGDFQRRADVNKRHIEAKASASVITWRTDLPESPVDEDVLVDEIAKAGQHNAAIEREIEHRAQRRADIDKAHDKVRDYQAKAEVFRKEALALDERAKEMDKAGAALLSQTAADLANLESAGDTAKPIDVAEVRANLTKAQEINKAINQADEARRRKSSYEKVAAEAALASDELTAKMNARNKEKEAAIAAAEMPVPGLGFGDGCVLLNGVPFDQGSDAERLRTSCAIAMKTHSQLRVIRVRDGSLLDDASMAILAEMAKANDTQIWIETVRAVTGSAVVISDGRVQEAQESAA